MLIVILLSIGLSACSSTRSFERTSDGSTVYLDQLSPVAKAESRRAIVQRLTHEVALFRLAAGDEITVLFDVNPQPTRAKYLISVNDKLRIEFLNDPENSRTTTVRPDGRISLAAIGPVMAVGLTPDSLARHIERRYGEMLGQSQITVDVIQAHSPLDRFVAMIGPSTKSLSLNTSVLPDGTISLPLLPPLQASERSLEELQHDIDKDYASLGLGVTVSLIPRVLRKGSTMVMGEVAKPGRIPLDRPHTVLMAVARAGGVLPTGSLQSVRMFYIASDGQPRVRVINLKEVMNDLKLEDDMIVTDNSIIYVPPTELAKAARLSKTIAEILQINGFGFTGAYIVNQPNTTTVPTR